jgi:putative endonuclease
MEEKWVLGRRGEDFTIDYLRSKGFLIAERNWRYWHYEVDIIAVKRGVLHIVEVKTRQASDNFMEQATLAINHTKREGLLRAANVYIARTHIAGEVQFDLAAVEVHLDGTLEMHYVENIMG